MSISCNSARLKNKQLLAEVLESSDTAFELKIYYFYDSVLPRSAEALFR